MAVAQVAQAAFGDLIDSMDHVLEIVDYQSIEGLHNMIVEYLVTPRRLFDWVVHINPTIQRDDGLFYEVAVGLRTRVNGLVIKVEVCLFLGDEDHQRLSLGEQILRIGGGLEEYGVIFPVKLAEAGVAVADALKIPKYKQEGDRSTVRLKISINMYRENVVIL